MTAMRRTSGGARTTSAGASVLRILAIGFALAAAGCSTGRIPSFEASRSGPDQPFQTGPTLAPHQISGARGTLTSARLDLVSGTDSATVTSADLGDALFQAVTPADARQIPQAAVSGGAVTVSLRDAPGPGPAQVTVVLNSRVDWSVSFDAGASAEHVDLTGAHLKSLVFAAGSSSISATLPAPSGDVTVLMQGGASRFDVRTPASVPYRISFGSGAGSAIVDGVVHSGIAAGTVITSPSWDTAANRYTIAQGAGVSVFDLATG
jgi:hypothetical protein